MGTHRLPLSLNAGPLAMPSIRLQAGDPSLAPENAECVQVPQLAEMPDARSSDSLWPFLRRVGETCLYKANATPPVLSELSPKDNTGPQQLRLNLHGRKTP